MGKLIMRVEGLDGQVELMTDRVVIKREGILNALKYGFNAKREIPLAAISEVDFKDAHALRFGEIEFVRGGRSSDEKKKNAHAAVRFKKNKQKQFEALKEKTFELLAQHSRSVK